MNKDLKTDRKFKRLLIYPKFQLMAMLIQGAFMAFAFGTVILQLNRSFSQFKTFGSEIHLQPTHPFFRLINLQANHLYLNFSIAFLISIIFSSFTTLIISHKLAGPIVRTREYFRNILKNGKRERELSFREGDFFPELPALINGAIHVIENPTAQKDSTPSGSP